MNENQIYKSFLRAKEKIELFESDVASDRWKRFHTWPLKILLRNINHKIFRKRIKLSLVTPVFFGEKMRISLPRGGHSEKILFTGTLGCNETSLIAFLINILPASKVFFDVGANYGFYTLLGYRLLKEGGVVHSFEPTPQTFDFLKENIKGKKRICINQVAVSDKIGFSQLFIHPKYDGANSLEPEIRPGGYESSSSISVSCVTIDKYCAENNVVPEVMKFDIEGGEYRALLGARSVMAKYKPLIVIEVVYKPHNNSQHLQAVELLFQSGYKAFYINENGRLKHCGNKSLVLSMKEEKKRTENVAFIHENQEEKYDIYKE